MKVYIEQKDWDKIINYARCASDKWGTEIGGMAVTRQDEDGDWQIIDPVIMKQEVSAALCELDKTELAQYYSKAAMKYKKDNIRFCWWHSHAKMSAFWSGTDTNTIDEYEDGDLSFALVVNVKEEYKCRVSVWKPFTMHEDVELEIVGAEEGYKIPKKIAKEVEAQCTQPQKSWYNSGTQWRSVTENGVVKNFTVPNPNQTSLFKSGIAERNVITNAWIQLIEKVQKINDGFVMGEYQYPKYANKIKDLNRRLENAKMPLSVQMVSQGNFEEILHLEPSDFIVCETGYEDCDPTDALLDYEMYNKSYNI